MNGLVSQRVISFEFWLLFPTTSPLQKSGLVTIEDFRVEKPRGEGSVVLFPVSEPGRMRHNLFDTDKLSQFLFERGGWSP